MRLNSRILGSSANELSIEVSLFYLKVEKTSPNLIVEEIGLGLQSVTVALMLLVFATRAVFFSAHLVVQSLEIALLCLQNCVYATFFGVYRVYTSLDAIWGVGARGTTAQGSWSLGRSIHVARRTRELT